MKILHIIAGLPCAGGMSELVPLLASEQCRLGHDVTVATVGCVGAVTVRQAQRAGVRMVSYRSCWPNFLYYSLEMHRKLGALVKTADRVHVHGCWTFPVWWGCHSALKHHIPYIRSPHGCLERERLKLSSWKKRLAGLFFERRYFARAAVIHATAESEAEGIREYLRSSFVHYCGSALVGEDGAVDKPQSAGSANLPISQPATPLSLPSSFRSNELTYQSCCT
jgi:glycosyltransferase involved in cell wall biosynthesis